VLSIIPYSLLPWTHEDDTYLATWTWEGDGDQLEGFNLYVDGSRVERVEGRMYQVVGGYEPQCGERHGFTVTAYGGGGESLPSNTVTWAEDPCPRQVRVTFETLHTQELPDRYWRAVPSFGGFSAQCTTVGEVNWDQGLGSFVFGLGESHDYDLARVFRDMLDSGLSAPASNSVVVEVGPGDDLTLSGTMWDASWDEWERFFNTSETIAEADLVPGLVTLSDGLVTLDVRIDVVVGPGAPEQPDLIITDITADEASGQLRFHVLNNGADLVDQDIAVRLESLVSGNEIATITWEDVTIPSGDERRLQTSDVVHGPNDLRAIVDPRDAIDETNEENNIFETSVEMRVQLRKLTADMHVCEHWLHADAEVYFHMWVGRGTRASEVEWVHHVRYPAHGEAIIDRYAQAYHGEPAPVWNVEDNDAYAFDLEIPAGERLWIRIEGYESDYGDDDAMGTVQRSYGAEDNWGDGTSTGWIPSTGYGTTDEDCNEDRGIGNVHDFAGFKASWAISRLD
jgi:hypothetical protein